MGRTKQRSRIGMAVGLAMTLLPVHGGPRMLYAQGAEPLEVVVNKANAATVAKADVKKMLLGQTTTWSNGQAVVVVLSAPGTPARTAELTKSCGMNESDFTRYQMQVSFTGRTGANVRDEASVVAIKSFVKTHPGAIAFLRKSDVDADLKAAGTLP